MEVGKKNVNLKKLGKNKNKVLAVIILIVLVVSGLRYYYEEYFMGDFLIALGEGCGIEYGHPGCVEDILRIPFYNPNEQDITSIKMTIPYGAGDFEFALPADFNVREPLRVKKTGVLSFFKCEKDINTDIFILEWCCMEKCYETRMNRPNEKVRIAIS